MTAPLCSDCRRREEFGGHDICGAEAPVDPPPPSDWRARRAGCLVCAAGAILFWFGVWILTTIAWR